MKKDLKAVPKANKGLSKLPTKVRNKMGFFNAGGGVNAHKEEAMKSPPKPRVRGYAKGGGVKLSNAETTIIPDYEGPRTAGDYYDYLSSEEKAGIGSAIGKPVLPSKKLKKQTDVERFLKKMRKKGKK